MTADGAETRNDISGTAENVLQARTVIGDVHFGSSMDDDVAITIPHTDNTVELPLHGLTLSVQIENRGTVDRHLFLRAVGVPGKLGQDKVTVRPSETVLDHVSLSRTRTSPEAATWELQIQAFDQDHVHLGRPRWVSKPKKVVIPSEPEFSLTFEPNPLKIITSDRYQVQSVIHNTGNKRIGGSLSISEAPDHAQQCQVHIPEDIKVGPGAEQKMTILLNLPIRELRSRSFRLGFTVKTDGPGLTKPAGLTVVQVGVFGVAVHGFRRLRKRSRTLTTGRIMDSLIAAIAAGLIIGFLGSSAPPPAVTISAPAVVPLPVAAPTSDPAPETEPSVQMPCNAAFSIVFLAALDGPEATKYGAYFAGYEKEHVARTAPDMTQRFPVHSSTWEQTCGTLRGDRPHGGRVYIWLGPVPTGEAGTICQGLHKLAPHFCLVKPTTQ